MAIDRIAHLAGATAADLLAGLRNQPDTWLWTGTLASVIFLAASWSVLKRVRAILAGK
ncbi:MAG: hypothetical protein JST11_29055 [Acidobacteria bacterium]|nr:hypothetical protein [Acidobacteriota bacterium]